MKKVDAQGIGTVLDNWRLRLAAVGLPAVLAGGFEFLRHGLQSLAGLPEDLGNLITAGLALLGGTVYFHAVASLVARLTAEAAQADTERAVLAQRQAIAEDLHDSLLQAFFLLHLRLRKALDHVDQSSQVAAELAEALETAQDVYLDLRETIARLHAPNAVQDQPGPADGALQSLVSSVLAGSDISVQIESEGGIACKLSPERWSAVRAILLEALRNVRKHAHASRARIWLRPCGQGGEAGVEDDGCGLEPSQAKGFGLTAIRRRAAAAGLELDIASAPGCGTRVRVAWGQEGSKGHEGPLSGVDR